MNKQESVITIIRETVNGIEIDPNGGDVTRPFSDLGIDSLDVAGIFLGIQEKLGISVPDDEIDGLNSIEKIVTYLDASAEG